MIDRELLELADLKEQRDELLAKNYLQHMALEDYGITHDQQAQEIERLRKQRDELLAALEQIASGEDDNGSILSGGECQCIAYEVIASVKEKV